MVCGPWGELQTRAGDELNACVAKAIQNQTKVAAAGESCQAPEWSQGSVRCFSVQLGKYGLVGQTMDIRDQVRGAVGGRVLGQAAGLMVRVRTKSAHSLPQDPAKWRNSTRLMEYPNAGCSHPIRVRRALQRLFSPWRGLPLADFVRIWHHEASGDPRRGRLRMLVFL